MDQNHFGRGSPKDHLFEIILKLGQGFRRSCCLSQKLTDGWSDDGQRPISKAHLVTL